MTDKNGCIRYDNWGEIILSSFMNLGLSARFIICYPLNMDTIYSDKFGLFDEEEGACLRGFLVIDDKYVT